MATVKESRSENASGGKTKRTVTEAEKQPDRNIVAGAISYFKGVATEWGKISWPTWPQIWGQTLVVIVMTSIMSLGLWIIDNVFRILINLLVHHHL